LAPGSGGTVHPADGVNLNTLTGYKLKNTSLMINAAINISGMGAHDFYGTPIPYNNAFDIGANEYSVVVAPPTFQFINFTGAVVADHAMLLWKVSNELNLNTYEIQVSSDSVNFHSIGNVLASSSSDYNYSDYNFSSGSKQYYRIRAVDNQGNSSFSNVIKIQSTSVTSAGIYYKEGSGLVVRMNNATEQPIIIGIYDAGGKKLLIRNLNLITGDNTITIQEAINWPKGIYIVRLSYKEQLSLKFIK
jgi:hypothetical protein